MGHLADFNWYIHTHHIHLSWYANIYGPKRSLHFVILFVFCFSFPLRSCLRCWDVRAFAWNIIERFWNRISNQASGKKCNEREITLEFYLQMDFLTRTTSFLLVLSIANEARECEKKKEYFYILHAFGTRAVALFSLNWHSFFAWFHYGFV